MRDEINAEMLLEQLYPELTDKWIVRCKGAFYRNYSSDAMAFDAKAHEVSLARDGFLKLLPDALLTDPYELTDRTIEGKSQTKEFSLRYAEMKQRLRLLEEAFTPLDTFAFRRKLQIERQVRSLMEMKLSYILKNYFDFDLEAESDGYVRKAAMLLPYIAKLRGRIQFVRQLLSTLTGYEVKMYLSTYSDRDDTLYGMTKVRYDLLVNELDSATYKKLTERFTPLIEFVKMRFLPFDALCEVEIKGRNRSSKLLNYNSYV